MSKRKLVMKKPLKAALFSAFIFPGCGQLLLKKYYSAVFYAFFASIGLYFLFGDLRSRAQDIVDKVQRGEITADLASISALVHQQSANTIESISPALTILFIAWLVSVVEAYRVGNKLADIRGC